MRGFLRERFADVDHQKIVLGRNFLDRSEADVIGIPILGKARPYAPRRRCRSAFAWRIDPCRRERLPESGLHEPPVPAVLNGIQTGKRNPWPRMP